jgi:LytTr DNA-binding domain
MSEITTPKNNTNPQSDDTRTDQLTFLWVMMFMSAALLIDILSDMSDIGQSQSTIPALHYVIYETTGYFFILAMFPLIAWTASRATPGQHDWRIVVPAHLTASVLVSFLHVGLMVAARKLIFLVVYSRPYTFSNDLPQSLIYEYRKDILTYSLFLFFIIFGRQLAQQRREIAAACEDAKITHRLTLKCGGRSIWVNASDVRWVKSASNYVEVAANGKTHLARATLSAVENQLNDAGISAVRVHRSYVINTNYIEAIEPTGEGDVKIEMSDGQIIPGSRRYRDRLPANAP